MSAAAAAAYAEPPAPMLSFLLFWGLPRSSKVEVGFTLQQSCHVDVAYIQRHCPKKLTTILPFRRSNPSSALILHSLSAAPGEQGQPSSHFQAGATSAATCMPTAPIPGQQRHAMHPQPRTQLQSTAEGDLQIAKYLHPHTSAGGPPAVQPPAGGTPPPTAPKSWCRQRGPPPPARTGDPWLSWSNCG